MRALGTDLSVSKRPGPLVALRVQAQLRAIALEPFWRAQSLLLALTFVLGQREQFDSVVK